MSDREREFVSNVVGMIHEGDDDYCINDYCQKFAEECPEQVFDMDRLQLASLRCHPDGIKRIGEWKKPVDELVAFPGFRSLVEKAHSSGMTKPDLHRIFFRLKMAANELDGEIDDKAVKSYLQRIKKGELAERAKQLTKRGFREAREQALVMYLEDKEGLLGVNHFNSNQTQEEDYFYLVNNDYRRSWGRGLFIDNIEGAVYMMGVTGCLVLGAVVGAVGIEAGYVAKESAMEFLLSCTAGGGAIAAVPCLADLANYFRTKHAFRGEIRRIYSNDKVIGAVSELFTALPPEKYHQIAEEIQKVGVETERKLNPYQIIGMVKERMS